MKSSDKNILTAFLLNLTFVIIEIAGGLLTNSIAIFADAVHDFGDCLSIGLAWRLEKLSGKRADDRYTYGYKRYSALAAVLTAAVLVAGSVFAVVESVKRLLSPQELNSGWMIIVAVIGVVVNGLAVLKTSHGRSSNERLISLHMLEDVLGWAAVLAGSVVIRLTGFTRLDPILSICVAAFILFEAIKGLVGIAPVFLERAPSGLDVAAYRAALNDAAPVHHLHVWSIGEDEPAATLHMVLPAGSAAGDISASRARLAKISEDFGVTHLTIQTEFEGEECGTGNGERGMRNEE